ncbi:MAG: type II toxin-antitoxin system HicA family toxin [Verrucomicrobiae bacterium]|nr:type II toxin-antitoxin system HicA family toxin [Verrucomicrobiae bacterium]
MPRKIRELESILKKAGFVWEAGKGSHRKWRHTTGTMIIMSGNPGHDAKRYQEKQVFEALEEVQQHEK